jgi:site-specific DNA recombinase
MIRVALYARVSSERQAQQDTIDSQLAALRERAGADGIHIAPADEYVDDGISGATLDRPALERLRDRAAEGGVDRLYVECPDRLSRRYVHAVVLIEELKRHGVEVVFLQRPSVQNAEDALLFQVQGVLAEYERARIAERCRRGKLHQARMGKVNPLGHAPYGYRYVHRSELSAARFEVLAPEAKVVREVFDAFVHQQRPMNAIAHALNDQGVPTRTGVRWGAPTIHNMLKNSAYMGQAVYGKTARCDPKPQLRSPRPRSATPKPRRSYDRTPAEKWISISVPPIVSAEIFAAAQEQLSRNRQLARRRARPETYLLQGLVVCAVCRYGMCGRTNALANGRTHRYYFCRGRALRRGDPSRRCNNPGVRAEELEALVWTSVCQTLREPARLEAEWRHRLATDSTLTDARAERDLAQRWTEAQERSLKRLLDAYEAGAMTLEELTPRTQRLREQLRHAEQMVKEADVKVTDTVMMQSAVGRLETFARQVQDRLDQLDWSARRQLVRMLVVRVEIDAEKVTVVYRLPPPQRAPDEPPGAAAPADLCRLDQGRQGCARSASI